MSEKELKLEWAGCDGMRRAKCGAFDMTAWGYTPKIDEFGFYVEYEGEVLVDYCGNPTLESAQLAAENAARDLCEEFRRLSEVLGPKETI